MNVFVTDHPLSSDSVRRNTWMESVVAIALLLCPFLLGLFWFANAIGNEDTTDYTPDPFWEVLAGAIIYSLLIAFAAVGLYRLSSWLLRKKCPMSMQDTQP